MPRGKCARSRITAAATTGPANGAQPASSTPATGSGCTLSSLKQGRAMEGEIIRGLERLPARKLPRFNITVDEALELSLTLPPCFAKATQGGPLPLPKWERG